MELTKKQIKDQFNANAAQYDPQRSKLIPCFNDFYSIPITLLESKNETPSILDIGAGTGLFSAFIKEKFPKANITLIDLSEKMMAVAKNRFKSEEHMEYIIADYTQYEFTKTYDIVISSLSIHHLSHEEKKKLYATIFSILNEGGIFINADQVLGHTPFIESIYKNDWKNKIEASGLTEQELQAAYERTKLDKMSPLQDQLNWLQESGFQDVDCVYKYFNFVVLYGKK